VRATVDRQGTDSESRPPNIKVRRVRKGDLSRVRDVVEQSFGDFFERQLGTRPRSVFNGAQYVHHRWLMEPWGCFVAEDHEGKIIGAVVAVIWGSLGVVGPLAVLTNYQNQHVGQHLLRAAHEFLDENKVPLTGVVTYPNSPKHLRLFHRFGYKPKGLVAIMSRIVEPPGLADGARADSGRGEGGRIPKVALAVRRFSALEEARKKVMLQRLRRITNTVCRGLDLVKEVEIVDGLALGETYLLENGKDLLGFAICHIPGVSEAPAGTLYVKFLALDRAHRRPDHFLFLLGALEAAAVERGLGRTVIPVYLKYFLAYQILLDRGYQVDFTMVRMQRGRLEDYEDPADLVLDDWR
jgi:ribosomal protein S18 acetylase RimI-like enzyme